MWMDLLSPDASETEKSLDDKELMTTVQYNLNEAH